MVSSCISLVLDMMGAVSVPIAGALCRWSAFFAEAPVTIAPFVEFHTPSSDPVHGANVLIASYNVGPATNETDAYFQELDAYLRPRCAFLANSRAGNAGPRTPQE